MSQPSAEGTATATAVPEPLAVRVTAGAGEAARNTAKPSDASSLAPTAGPGAATAPSGASKNQAATVDPSGGSDGERQGTASPPADLDAGLVGSPESQAPVRAASPKSPPSGGEESEQEDSPDRDASLGDAGSVADLGVAEPTNTGGTNTSNNNSNSDPVNVVNSSSANESDLGSSNNRGSDANLGMSIDHVDSASDVPSLAATVVHLEPLDVGRPGQGDDRDSWTETSVADSETATLPGTAKYLSSGGDTAGGTGGGGGGGGGLNLDLGSPNNSLDGSESGTVSDTVIDGSETPRGVDGDDDLPSTFETALNSEVSGEASDISSVTSDETGTNDDSGDGGGDDGDDTAASQVGLPRTPISLPDPQIPDVPPAVAPGSTTADSSVLVSGAGASDGTVVVIAANGGAFVSVSAEAGTRNATATAAAPGDHDGTGAPAEADGDAAVASTSDAAPPQDWLEAEDIFVEDVWMVIMSFLDLPSFVRLMLVSRYLNNLGRSDEYWKEFARQRWHRVSKGQPDRIWYEYFRSKVKNTAKNWVKGPATLRTLWGHTDRVVSLDFDDRILATGSVDTTIKLWDIWGKDRRCLSTLEGHTSYVSALSLDGDDALYSASMTVKQWDTEAGMEVLSVEFGSFSYDLKIARGLGRQVVVVGCNDSVVRVVDLTSGEVVGALEGHDGPVFCLALCGDTLITGSQDTTARIWDLRTMRQLGDMDRHKKAITSVYWESEEAHPFTGSSDKTVRHWNVHTKKKIKSFQGHSEGVVDVAVLNNMLITGSNDRTIKIWNVRKGRCVRTLAGVCGNVHCFKARHDMLFVGSVRTVNIFDFTAKQSGS